LPEKAQLLKEGPLPDLDFSDKLFLFGQELKLNLSSAINTAIADAVAQMANKQPQTIVIGQETLEKANQQILEQGKVIDSLNKQVGKYFSSRPT
jgi:hypothetical protein